MNIAFVWHSFVP